MHKRSNVLGRFFQNKHGNLVIWQMPNLPLISWAVFLVLARSLPHTWQQIALWLSFGSLMVWALLEVVLGASYFRRALGLAVIIWSIYTRLQ
jgi:hypothetical protein